MRKDLNQLKAELRALPKEVRTFSASIELRGTDDAPELVGHSIVFNQLSEVLGGWFQFREKIAPGAFTKSIASKPIIAFWSHQTSMPLGRTDEGTLIVREDATGVHSTIRPGDSSWEVDAVKQIRRRNVKHQSFGMRVLTDDWNVEDGMDIRTVLEGELIEVSPVALPAYPQTNISADISARCIEGTDLREIFAAYQSCRSGAAVGAEIELVRRVARALNEASGPTPDEIKRKLEYHRRRLALLAA